MPGRLGGVATLPAFPETLRPRGMGHGASLCVSSVQIRIFSPVVSIFTLVTMTVEKVRETTGVAADVNDR
jgi:hypothetical protein